MSLCLYVCKAGCLSIVLPCVAKQPCVCTLKWGWKREGKHWVNGDRRSHTLLHLIEHTNAPDEWGWPLSLWLTVDINCESYGPFLHSTGVGFKVGAIHLPLISKEECKCFWLIFLLKDGLKKLLASLFDHCKRKQQGVSSIQYACVCFICCTIHTIHKTYFILFAILIIGVLVDCNIVYSL